MKAKLLLLLAAMLTAFSSNAATVAVASSEGTSILLTDEQRQDICPINMGLAKLVEGDEVKLVGCWAPMEGGELGIFWLTPMTIPKAAFTLVSSV